MTFLKLTPNRRFLKATSGRTLSSKGQEDDEEEETTAEVTVDPDTDRPTMLWDKIKNKKSTVCDVVEPIDPETPKPQGNFEY